MLKIKSKKLTASLLSFFFASNIGVNAGNDDPFFGMSQEQLEVELRKQKLIAQIKKMEQKVNQQQLEAQSEADKTATERANAETIMLEKQAELERLRQDGKGDREAERRHQESLAQIQLQQFQAQGTSQENAAAAAKAQQAATEQGLQLLKIRAANQAKFQETLDKEKERTELAIQEQNARKEVVGKVGEMFANILKRPSMYIGFSFVIFFFFFVKYVFPILVKKFLAPPPDIISDTNIPKGIHLKRKKEEPIEDPVYPDELQEQMDKIIAEDIKSIKGNRMLEELLYTFRHILLYGPPGTGKTLFANYLAWRAGFLRINIKGSTFSRRSTQDAIDGIYELLEYANRAAIQFNTPVLIFLDEIDVICPRRNDGSSSDVQNKITTAILTYFDKGSHKRVKFVLATNNLNMVDEALVSRCADVINIPLPNKEARAIMIRNLLSKNLNPKFGVTVEARVFKNIDLVAEKTEGLSGRDLQAVFSSLIQEVSHNPKKTGERKLSYERVEKDVTLAVKRKEQETKEIEERERERMRRRAIPAY
ncbi:MAG: AAA family ATPase [Bacteroidota bacterium]